MTPKVQEALRAFPPQTKRYIREACGALSRDPWLGKLLRDDLAGLYSLRARRFRIVYQVHRRTVTVIVIAIGHRRHVYEEVAAEIRSR